MLLLFCITQSYRIHPLKSGDPEKSNWQTVQTQIRCLQNVTSDQSPHYLQIHVFNYFISSNIQITKPDI